MRCRYIKGGPITKDRISVERDLKSFDTYENGNTGAGQSRLTGVWSGSDGERRIPRAMVTPPEEHRVTKGTVAPIPFVSGAEGWQKEDTSKDCSRKKKSRVGSVVKVKNGGAAPC